MTVVEVVTSDQRERIMENALIPVIVTIGISTLIIVASVLGTFVVLLNHLSARIDQSEERVTSAAAKDKAELLETIRDTERRLTHRMDRSDDRIERFEARTTAQFEMLRRELRQSAAEQPVTGDD